MKLASALLPSEFYAQPTLEVAQQLLGKILVRAVVHRGKKLILKGRIVETEGYIARIDEACHAYRRKTPRNAAMFGEAGTAYVYFTYGNHFMLNVVTEKVGDAAAVLIRAIEPVEYSEAALAFMREQRRQTVLINLTNGPGKLTEAFMINHALNEMSLQSPALYIEDAPLIPKKQMAVSTRVGITRSVELPWRYFINGNKFVSQGKPSGNDGVKNR
jgi:DNA-3-methyladenine glycosylase